MRVLACNYEVAYAVITNTLLPLADAVYHFPTTGVLDIHLKDSNKTDKVVEELQRLGVQNIETPLEGRIRIPVNSDNARDVTQKVWATLSRLR